MKVMKKLINRPAAVVQQEQDTTPAASNERAVPQQQRYQLEMQTSIESSTRQEIERLYFTETFQLLNGMKTGATAISHAEAGTKQVNIYNGGYQGYHRKNAPPTTNSTSPGSSSSPSSVGNGWPKSNVSNVHLNSPDGSGLTPSPIGRGSSSILKSNQASISPVANILPSQYQQHQQAMAKTAVNLFPPSISSNIKSNSSHPTICTATGVGPTTGSTTQQQRPLTSAEFQELVRLVNAEKQKAAVTMMSKNATSNSTSSTTHLMNPVGCSTQEQHKTPSNSTPSEKSEAGPKLIRNGTPTTQQVEGGKIKGGKVPPQVDSTREYDPVQLALEHFQTNLQKEEAGIKIKKAKNQQEEQNFNVPSLGSINNNESNGNQEPLQEGGSQDDGKDRNKNQDKPKDEKSTARNGGGENNNGKKLGDGNSQKNISPSSSAVKGKSPHNECQVVKVTDSDHKEKEQGKKSTCCLCFWKSESTDKDKGVAPSDKNSKKGKGIGVGQLQEEEGGVKEREKNEDGKKKKDEKFDPVADALRHFDENNQKKESGKEQQAPLLGQTPKANDQTHAKKMKSYGTTDERKTSIATTQKVGVEPDNRKTNEQKNPSWSSKNEENHNVKKEEEIEKGKTTRVSLRNFYQFESERVEEGEGRSEPPKISAHADEGNNTSFGVSKDADALLQHFLEE